MKHNLNFIEAVDSVDKDRCHRIENKFGDILYIKDNKCRVVDNILKQQAMRYLCEWHALWLPSSTKHSVSPGILRGIFTRLLERLCE